MNPMGMSVDVVPPARKKAEKTEVSEAIRKEIIRIATEGSTEDDGALTPGILSRIRQVAKTGRDVLVALQASPTNLAALIKKRRRLGLGIPQLGIEDGDDFNMDDGLGDDAGMMGYGGGVLAPSPLGENFGMVALRELIAGMKQANQSPDRLVEALATARREGLHDVAKKLEEQLGLTPDAALPPTAPMSDVKVKISFPEPGQSTEGEDPPAGMAGLTGPTGCPPGELGDVGEPGIPGPTGVEGGAT